MASRSEGDHDIDSDLAWDITTGGQTDDGTRIVVAVLEGGGANYNHPDLIANHWVNDQEIPTMNRRRRQWVRGRPQRLACPRRRR